MLITIIIIILFLLLGFFYLSLIMIPYLFSCFRILIKIAILQIFIFTIFFYLGRCILSSRLFLVCLTFYLFFLSFNI